jgi:hypothetical protein
MAPNLWDTVYRVTWLHMCMFLFILITELWWRVFAFVSHDVFDACVCLFSVLEAMPAFPSYPIPWSTDWLFGKPFLEIVSVLLPKLFTLNLFMDYLVWLVINICIWVRSRGWCGHSHSQFFLVHVHLYVIRIVWGEPPVIGCECITYVTRWWEITSCAAGCTLYVTRMIQVFGQVPLLLVPCSCSATSLCLKGHLPFPSWLLSWLSPTTAHS